MPTSESPSLPLGWDFNRAALGGVDLRVVARGRRYLVSGLAVLAIMAAWRTLVNWKTVPAGSAAPWFGITLLLGLLAIWCAFADELWHIDRNYLEHRVGIGRCAHSRRYRDADLQIMLRFSTNFNVPYYRLYAIENGRSHFLIDRRDEQELRQLAAFISFHTGWRIRPMAPSPWVAALL